MKCPSGLDGGQHVGRIAPQSVEFRHHQGDLGHELAQHLAKLFALRRMRLAYAKANLSIYAKRLRYIFWKRVLF